MSVKANWNLADLDVSDAGDPMQDISNGKLIDLHRSEAEIFAELKDALSLEGYLWRVPKLRCPMKQEDNKGQKPPCATCPEYDPEGPIGRLCKVGVKQVDLLEELDAAHSNDTLDAELDSRLHEECEELAAACL